MTNSQQSITILNRHKRYYKQKFAKWLKTNSNIVNACVNQFTNNKNKRNDFKKLTAKKTQYKQSIIKEQPQQKQIQIQVQVQRQIQRQRQSTIPTMSQQQFLAYIKNIRQNNQLPNPVIIALKSQLKFTYPQKVIVRLAKNNNNNKKDNNYKKSHHHQLEQQQQQHHQQQVDQIICTRQSSTNNQQDDAVFLQVQKQQFLTLRQNNKTSDNQFQSFSVSIPQMQLTQKHYQQPQFLTKYLQIINNKNSSQLLYSVNLWHYIKHTLTKMHYDAHDNFLFQIKGMKSILLKKPNDINSICQKQYDQGQNRKQFSKQNYIKCQNVFGINSNHCLIQQQQQQSKIFSHINKVQLKQNHCLFIPRGWFHQVESILITSKQQQQLHQQQLDNIAINFWCNTIQSHSIGDQQLQINLKQLIFRMSNSICQKLIPIKQWNKIQQQSIRQSYRKAYFFRYLNMLLSGQSSNMLNSNSHK